MIKTDLSSRLENSSSTRVIVDAICGLKMLVLYSAPRVSPVVASDLGTPQTQTLDSSR